MHTRAIRATLIAVAFAGFTSTGVATAAPTELTVRIEGKERTLFEGPILTDGHDVRASSDKANRPCDGTNGGANPDPGPTPTAAAVDAMAIAGEDFDAKWFSGYDDYYVERWGPDAENVGAGLFWGLLVDGAFTSVGGCQFRSEPGDEVLWAYDAFGSKPFLRLATVADPSLPPGPAQPTASVEQGEDLTLSVKSYTGAMDGAPSSIQPVASAIVAPVATDPDTGYQEVETGDPAAVSTGAGGTVTVSFATTGWHRLKAVKAGHIRSNRLDVCVEPVGGGCGPLLPDAQVRTPPATPDPSPPEPPVGDPPPSGPAGGGSASATRATPSSIAFGRVVANRGAGSARIAISVPGPGLLTLSGGQVRKQSERVGASGSVTLLVRAKGRALDRLREMGRATVTVTTVFVPLQGVAASARRTVVLKRGDPAG